MRVSQGVLEERMKADDEEAVNEAVKQVQKFNDQSLMAFGGVQAVQHLIDTCDLEEVEPVLVAHDI